MPVSVVVLCAQRCCSSCFGRYFIIVNAASSVKQLQVSSCMLFTSAVYSAGADYCECNNLIFKLTQFWLMLTISDQFMCWCIRVWMLLFVIIMDLLLGACCYQGLYIGYKLIVYSATRSHSFVTHSMHWLFLNTCCVPTRNASNLVYVPIGNSAIVGCNE